MVEFRRILSILIVVVIFTSCTGNKPANIARTGKKDKKSAAAEYYLVEGMKHFMLEDYQEALAEFLKAADEQPESAAIHHMLSRTYFEKQDVQQSLEHARKAVKLNPDNKFYYLFLARLHLVREDYSSAEKIYKDLIQNVGDTDEYLDNLAEIYIMQNKTEEAIDVLNRVETEYGKTEQVTRRKQQLYLKENKIEKALEEGYLLINAFPDNLNYKINQAEMLVSYDRKEEALKLLQEVTLIDPENPYAQFILANIYKSSAEPLKANDQLLLVFQNPNLELDVKLDLLSELNRNENTSDQQLLEFIEAVEEAHSDEPRTYLAYGDLYLQMGKKKEAWEKYILAKEMERSNYSIWNQLLLLDSEMGYYDSLASHAEQALEYYPNQASFWYFLGSAQYMQKNYDEASISLEQGKNLAISDDRLRMMFLQLLGDAYNELKEYELSDKAYEDALHIDRNNPHVLNNYSYFLSLREEKLELAREMASMLIDQQPDNATFLDTYGWVLFKLGEYQQAEEIFQKAVQLSSDGTILEHYGDVLFKLGKKDQALEQWKKAKKSGGASEDIDEKISSRKIN